MVGTDHIILVHASMYSNAVIFILYFILAHDVRDISCKRDINYFHESDWPGRDKRGKQINKGGIGI